MEHHPFAAEKLTRHRAKYELSKSLYKSGQRTRGGGKKQGSALLPLVAIHTPGNVSTKPQTEEGLYFVIGQANHHCFSFVAAIVVATATFIAAIIGGIVEVGDCITCGLELGVGGTTTSLKWRYLPIESSIRIIDQSRQFRARHAWNAKT
jgi:hypothetical protein